MNQQQWQAPGGSNMGGSVRRARENMAAGTMPKVPPPMAPRTMDFEAPRAVPRPRGKPQPQSNTAGPVKNGPLPIGVAISRPTQVPQWPLSGTIEGGSPEPYEPPPNRGPPPPRPPRPSHVPSLLDASKLQDHTPVFPYQPTQSTTLVDQGQSRMRYQDDEYALSSPSTDAQSSSRPSTVSSVGSIPDFPVPAIPVPVPARRSANLGPPPSSRRGASSYYSQASYVSPIPEVSESPRTSRTIPSNHSHGSYASSAAIPSSWGTQSPGYHSDADSDDVSTDEIDDVDEDSDDYSPMEVNFGYGMDVVPEGHESRSSLSTDGNNDESGLIRSASFGKRGKPSLISTRTANQANLERPDVFPLQRTASEFPIGAAVTVDRVEDPFRSGTGLIDGSISSSDLSAPQIGRAVTVDEATLSPPARAQYNTFQAASALHQDQARTKSPIEFFNRLSAIRQPPRLDMNAVRDAEARGSLTSLPDLIRRATRLAAMMDRGTRPGSVLSVADWPTEKGPTQVIISPGKDEKYNSGLSGMLAAFPNPGNEARSQEEARTSQWPPPQPSGSTPSKEQKEEKKARKCCGLPCWGFVLVFIILLIIIAAAVVVPLKFLVIDKPKNTTAATTTGSGLVCSNGGVTVIQNGASACICINGFTGNTCTIANAPGCTTITLTDGTKTSNATLGNAIPRLLSGAQTNFSIPLSSTAVLASFNNGNLSCNSENAFVTFNGQASRIGNANDVVSAERAQSLVQQEQEQARVVSPADAQNKGVIVIGNPDSTFISTAILSDTTTTTTTTSSTTISTAPTLATPTIGSPTSAPTETASSSAVPTESASSSASPSPSSTPSSTPSASVSSTFATSSTPTSTSTLPTATSTFAVTQEVLDFSRVAVLYIMQQETLNSAVSAQSALQKFFTSGAASGATNVSLGGMNSVNLVALSVDAGNGTIGGKMATSVRKQKRESEPCLWELLDEDE